MSRAEIADDPIRLHGGSSSEEGSGDESTRVPELGTWLRDHHGPLATRWLVDVEARVGSLEPERKALLAEFFDLFLTLLPECLGPYRTQFEPLWRQLSELYGSVGAMRSLAAGEVTEEFQVLREAMIRYLFAAPPDARRTPLLLREILRLNRLIDKGVTEASVAHTDALFFALLKGTGAPQSMTPELLERLREQMSGVRQEAGRLRNLLKR
jgi:hypothetical protein